MEVSGQQKWVQDEKVGGDNVVECEPQVEKRKCVNRRVGLK